jgi:hypothetical protein
MDWLKVISLIIAIIISYFLVFDSNNEGFKSKIKLSSWSSRHEPKKDKRPIFGTGGQYINKIIESYLGKTLTKILYFFMSVYFFYYAVYYLNK